MAVRSDTLCMASAGGFFLVGLVTGAWKYFCIARSPEARAPYYVDTAHRAALLYAFACGLLGFFCGDNAWSPSVTCLAAALLIAYFAVSVLGYIVHGALRDTDNQLARPHRLGARTIPSAAMTAFMLSLITVEIGSFLVIFTGYLGRHR
jgi:hypothetical protein